MAEKIFAGARGRGVTAWQGPRGAMEKIEGKIFGAVKKMELPRKKTVEISKKSKDLHAEYIGKLHCFNLLRERYNDEHEEVQNSWKKVCEAKEIYRESEKKIDSKLVDKNILKFLITFTANNDNDDLSADEAIKCLKKCVNSKRQKVLRYYGALELTKSGRIHGHLCIEYEKNENKEGWGQSFFKKASGWNYGTINVKPVEWDNGVCNYIKKDQSKENPLPCIGEPF